MKKVIFFGIVMLLIIVSCDREERTAIEGVWKCTEDSFVSTDTSFVNKSPQPNLYIFGKEYYSVISVSGNEPRPLMEAGATRNTITDEQVRSIFMGFFANSGKYELDGSKLTTRPIVALWPNTMEAGYFIEFEYKMVSDTLQLTLSRPNGVRKFNLIPLER